MGDTELDEEERRRQTREAFAKMYDLGADETKDGTNNNSFYSGASFMQPATAEDELNLNSVHFAPEKYVGKLLKERSLKGLMLLSSENSTKARELDTELQGLVYDNYNRFISATETIRKMRDNVVRMDEKLHTLEKNIDQVDHLTQSLQGKLEKGRNTIEEKIAISRMMKQIQFLVELPQQVRRCLNEGSYAVGAKYWAAGDNILHRHSDIASFRHILEESRSVALELQKVVLDRIRSTSMEGKHSLRETTELFDTLRALRQTSLGAGSSAADEHKLLMDPIQSRYEEDIRKIHKEIQAEFAARMSQPPTGLRLASKKNTRELLDAIVNVMLTFHTQMNRAGEMFARGNKEIPLTVRRALHTTMQQTLDELSKLTEQQTAYRLQQGLCKIDLTQAASATSGQEAVEHFLADIRMLSKTFREMAFTYLGDMAPDFITNIERMVGGLVGGISATIGKYTGEPNALLVLCAFSQGMAGYGCPELSNDGFEMGRHKKAFIELAQRLVQQFTVAQGRRFTESVRQNIEGTNWNIALAPSKVSQYCVDLARDLVTCRTVINNCIKVDPNTSKDAEKKKPKSGSSTGSQGTQGSVKRPGSSSVPSHVRSDTNSLASMERMFTAGATSTTAFSVRVSTMDPTSVFDVCLKYLFKSFQECVRIRLFGKNGFHQMQVDIGYLNAFAVQRKWLRTPAAQELLSEVLKSAFDRCTDRLAMDQEAVNTIVNLALPALPPPGLGEDKLDETLGGK